MGETQTVPAAVTRRGTRPRPAALSPLVGPMRLGVGWTPARKGPTTAECRRSATTGEQAVDDIVRRENRPQDPARGDLALYELQRPLVEPLLRMFRFCNTGLDFLFYDVGAFTAAMSVRGSVVETGEGSNSAADPSQPLAHLDLSAVTNPEGSILVVDANLPPYVERFDQMTEFLDYANGPRGRALRSVSITGVGSSALGSAAFAWNVSTALGEPVAAIVPGYG